MMQEYTLILSIQVCAEEPPQDLVDHTWLRSVLAEVFPKEQCHEDEQGTIEVTIYHRDLKRFV